MSISTPAILEVESIALSYGGIIPALRDVSLVVPQGAIVALLGANGAGKSTTLKAISALSHADRGALTQGGSREGGPSHGAGIS